MLVSDSRSEIGNGLLISAPSAGGMIQARRLDYSISLAETLDLTGSLAAPVRASGALSKGSLLV